MTNEPFGEEPKWVLLTRRLRVLAEQHGDNSEIGWVLNLAADEITSARTTCDSLYESITNDSRFTDRLMEALYVCDNRHPVLGGWKPEHE